MQPLSKEFNAVFNACKQSIWAVAVFSAVSNLLMLVPAFYMLNVYDKALANNSTATLVSLSVITFFMFLTLGGMEVVRGWVLVKVSSRLDAMMAPDLYTRTFLNAVNVGGDYASTQPLQDLNGLRRFVTGNSVFAFFDAPWVLVYIVILFLFDAALGVLGVVSATVLLALALLNRQRSEAAIKQANSMATHAMSDTQRNLRNAEVIHSMGMLTAVFSRWRKSQAESLVHQEAAANVSVLFNGVIKAFRLGIQSAALGLGAYLAISQQISPGMVIAGSILIGRALQPIELAVGGWRGFVDAAEQAKRLAEVTENIPLPEKTMPLPPIEGDIDISNAAVVPPGTTSPTLTCSALRIPAGETALILGPSGAGKTSLLRGILGIWPTAAGSIRIDGADVLQFNRDEIGCQLGYLPQSIELLEGSVAENIARFSDQDADAVIQAAKDAGVHEFILSLSKGYDTQLGDVGQMLSPGQKQRIALARAIYEYPKLVVLDEPNSNLDESGEAALNNAIELLKRKGSTVIVVSHRQGVMPLADVLVLVAGGTVTDSGPTAEVLARVNEQIKAKAAAEGVKSGEPAPTPRGSIAANNPITAPVPVAKVRSVSWEEPKNE